MLIFCCAYSSDPTGGSELVRLPDSERSRAVVVGIDLYYNLMRLPGAHAGAEAVKILLADPQYGSLRAEHCVLLPENASKDDVGKAFEVAADQAKDLLLIYF